MESCPAKNATGPVKIMPHRGDGQVWRHTRSSRLDLAASGIRRAISTSHSRQSGPVELQQRRRLSTALSKNDAGREHLVRLSRNTTIGMSMPHRFAWGMEPINSLSSKRPRERLFPQQTAQHTKRPAVFEKEASRLRPNSQPRKG